VHYNRTDNTLNYQLFSTELPAVYAELQTV